MTTLNRHEKLSGGRLFSANTRINTEDAVLLGLLGRPHIEGPHYGAINFVDHLPASAISCIDAAFGPVFTADPEGYAVILGDDITVYAPHPRGYLYAAYDILRLSEGGRVPQGIIYNRPNAEFRHLKVYLPPEENISMFKEVVDLCAAYRVNRLIIEVGGAMEYKKHPEINEKWVSYCEEMHEFSGKTEIIQEKTFPWGKNSIHCENGGGKYLTHEQVRDIVDYCEARHIEVIPEMPTLSHCDYLMLPHPEFAERRDDPYPDCYCPNAPGVYDYVFEVLQEVIDVFHPKAMHIGHDEYYSICVCPRCRNLSAPRLYADDIIKIHGFLAAQNVKTVIWSEKLLNAITRDGIHHGGSHKQYHFMGKVAHEIPPTFTSIDMIPRDVICMHWYWGIIQDWDVEFLGRDYYMFFGNFNPVNMPNAARRIRAGAKGGGPSNWSYATMPYLQENGVLLGLAYAAMLFWKEDAEDDRYTEFLEFCMRDLYAQRISRMTGPAIDILHGTKHFQPHRGHADGIFIDYESKTMGSYVVTYTDGTQARLPVIYGQNIANQKRDWTRHIAEPGVIGSTDMGSARINDSYTVDGTLCGMAYGTLPVRIGEDTYFLWRAENPHPDKAVASVVLEEKPGFEGQVKVLKIDA